MSPSSLLLLLAVAAPLAAQQPDSANLAPRDSVTGRHGFRNHGRPGRWNRRRDPFEPARLLQRKDSLGLSGQQVARLTALENRGKPEMKATLQQIRTERAAIAAGLKADAPDTVLLKRHYEALHTAAGNEHWARVSASLQARAILTDTQRSKVRGWAALRGGRWNSKGHGNRL